jgi:hypothetical protein
MKNVLRVFEDGGLRRLFGPKSNDVTREWRTLHNEELLICTHQILFGSSNQEE